MNLVNKAMNIFRADKKCSECGHKLNANDKFCAECGTKVFANKPKWCTQCGNELNSSQKFCNRCGGKIQNESDINLKKLNNYNTNNDIELLVFGYCRRSDKKLQMNIYYHLMSVIATYADTASFTFNDTFRNLFNFQQINNNNKQYNVQKINHKQHATIIFGENLKSNTFEARNYNLIFSFRILCGTVNLMFVPQSFEHWTGLISKRDSINNDYRILYLRAGYNYNYNEIIRVKIDMIELCANIENLSNGIKTKMNLKDINSKGIYCAFAMINPYSQFEIIDQNWQRKKELIKKYITYNNNNNNNNNNNAMDIDDVEFTFNNYNKPEIMQNKPGYDLSKLSSNHIQSGINYFGQCSNHIAVCNRGFCNDLKPEDDYFERNIYCNRCGKIFNYQTIILYDCNYNIKYQLNGTNTKLLTVNNTAYPEYVDVFGQIFKHQTYSYLKMSVTPIMY